MGHLVLLLLGFRVGTVLGWLLILALIALISFVLWILNFRRARVVADTPTSRVGSAPQGYVELHGVARTHPGNVLVGPLTATACVWFRFQVEEKRGKDWVVVQRGLSDTTFLLDDGTGEAVVDPEHAEVLTSRKRCWIRGAERCTEWLLVPDEPVYTIGEFSTVGGANAQLDPSADLTVLLCDWKRDQPRLKERFDLDNNGLIDPNEWELAVRAARREVGKRHQQIRSQPGVALVRAPHDGRVFLLSNLDPDALAHRYTWWTRVHLSITVLAGGAALWVITRTAIA